MARVYNYLNLTVEIINVFLAKYKTVRYNCVVVLVPYTFTTSRRARGRGGGGGEGRLL